MLQKRLIASLLCREGWVVQSIGFRHTNVIGNAITAVDFFNTWAIDEIVVLDVSLDLKSRGKFYQIIEDLSERCFVPLTVGGWVRSIDEIRELLALGADKVTINTEGIERPGFLEEAADVFGSQCVVCSIDARRGADGKAEVFADRGRKPVGRDAVSWAREAQALGAGEIYLTSIDQDGSQEGYDLELVRSVAQEVDVPVVAFGGVGHWAHLVEGIENGAEAVAVGNAFHFIEHSTRRAKEHMVDVGLDVRETVFYKTRAPRRPIYLQYEY